MDEVRINDELKRLEKFRVFLLEAVKAEQSKKQSNLDMYDIPMIKTFINRTTKTEQDFLYDYPEEFEELYLKYFEGN